MQNFLFCIFQYYLYTRIQTLPGVEILFYYQPFLSRFLLLHFTNYANLLLLVELFHCFVILKFCFNQQHFFISWLFSTRLMLFILLSLSSSCKSHLFLHLQSHYMSFFDGWPQLFIHLRYLQFGLTIICINVQGLNAPVRIYYQASQSCLLRYLCLTLRHNQSLNHRRI